MLLEDVISRLESMGGGDDAGFMDVDMTFFVGEETELYQRIFSKIDFE